MVSKIEELIGRLRAVDAAAELERARRDGRSFRGVRQDALFQETAAADAVDAIPDCWPPTAPRRSMRYLTARPR
jgi:hypothetical protein